MEIEELFCKRYPEYSVNGKPLHPYFDVFEEGYEQAEKKNAELKEKVEVLECDNYNANCNLNLITDQLTKATEIIKSLIALHYNPVVTKDDLKKQDKTLKQARQFLREIEK